MPQLHHRCLEIKIQNNGAEFVHTTFAHLVAKRNICCASLLRQDVYCVDLHPI